MRMQDIQGSEYAGRLLGLACYPIMIYSIVFLTTSAAHAAQIGFVIYSTLDLTNTFMFEKWTVKVSAVSRLSC